MGYREPVGGRLFLDRYSETYMVITGEYAPYFKAVCVQGQALGNVRTFEKEDMVIEWLALDATLHVVGDDGAQSGGDVH